MKQTLYLNFNEGDVPSLHPHYLQGPARCYTVGKLLFEGLTRLNEDGNAELAGAEDVIVSPCGTLYQFALRPSHWSDGSLVTAYDYERAWKWALDPASECPRAELLYVVKNAEAAKKGEAGIHLIGVKALDANTLSVELEFPAPYFLGLIALPIFSPLKAEELKKEPTRFNGPFVLKHWEKGNALYLKSNPNFWNRSEVSLKEVHISMVSDPNTAVQLFETQKISWLGDPFNLIPIDAISALQEKYAVQQREVVRPFWIFLNTKHPLLKSSSIRQALGAVLDRKEIAEHIFITCTPLEGPFPEKFALSDRKINNQNHIDLFSQGLNELNFNHSNCPELILSYYDHSSLKQLAFYLKEIWGKAFGINIKLAGYEWNTFYGNLHSGSYDIGGCYICPSYEDTAEPLTRLEGPSPSNFPQWIHPEFQSKLKLARTTDSREVRKKALQEAESLLIDEMPIIPVANRINTFVHDPNLKGYTVNYVGFVDFSKAYFD